MYLSKTKSELKVKVLQLNRELSHVDNSLNVLYMKQCAIEKRINESGQQSEFIESVRVELEEYENDIYCYKHTKDRIIMELLNLNEELELMI